MCNRIQYKYEDVIDNYYKLEEKIEFNFLTYTFPTWHVAKKSLPPRLLSLSTFSSSSVCLLRSPQGSDYRLSSSTMAAASSGSSVPASGIILYKDLIYCMLHGFTSSVPFQLS